MLKRFLAVFGLVLLYMAAIAVLLLPLILLLEEDTGRLLVAILIALVLASAGFVPYLDWAAKRAFRFRGEGAPVSEAALRAHILGINDFDAPVMIEERRRGLVATWRYVDARWWELLAKAGLTKTYELHVRLDEARHEATLIDVTRSVSWRAGPTNVRFGWMGFRGIVAGFEIGHQEGIQEDFEWGEIYDYDFAPQEIKTPVMRAILSRGWDVRFGMW